MDQEQKNNNPWAVPLAIIIAGAIVGGAIYFKSGQAPVAGPTGPSKETLAKIRPLSPTEHLRGNFNAPIKIVEYSDLECPFCKVFHTTMNKIMADYGATGKVAWVYRHFPLDSLHPQAAKEAEAAECAATLGGNDAFWKFIDTIFTITPSNNRLDLTLLSKTAVDIGLDQTAFDKCLASGQEATKVKADQNNALDAGGQGTPFSIVITPKGERIPLGGALPYDQLKQAIDQLLNKSAT